MNRIKEARKAAGLTQGELAEMLDVSIAAVSQWERNIVKPTAENLQVMSQILNMSIDCLLGASEKRNGFRIPVLGRVAAGIPIEAIEDIIDYEEIDKTTAKNGEYFALKIKGDSMEPSISDGDVVIVRKQDTIDSGKIAIVIVNGNDATCKRFVQHQDGISLIPLNPAYPPKFYTRSEVEGMPIRVIGRVVECRKKF